MASLSKLVTIMNEFEDLSRQVRDLIKDLADNPELDLGGEDITTLQLVQEFFTNTKRELEDLDLDEADDEISQAESNIETTLDELEAFEDEEDEEEEDEEFLEEDEDL